MKYAVAIDIGGTNIKYALVDSAGEIHYESLKSTIQKEGTFNFVEHLKIIVQDVLDVAKSKKIAIEGIGIGVPSVVDNGVVLFAYNLLDLNNLDLKGVIADYAQLPVFVENDANLMGLGEVKYGASKNLSDVVFLTIGTGIGGALILNGQLYGGYKNRGTELGHIIVEGNGNDCTCGTKGCLEAQASTTALIADYKNICVNNNENATTEADGKYIIAQYHENEKSAVEAMNNHFHYMALGVTSFINVFAPQKVIIGGGISESGDFYIDNIKQRVDKMVMKETSFFTSIERASLGNKAGFLGAAALVFNLIQKT